MIKEAFILIVVLLIQTSVYADEYKIWNDVAKDVGIKTETLYSIAIVESKLIAGGKEKGKVQAWPWTLNSNRYGGQFFKNKKETIEELNFLLSEGYTNVDIGIMQINWFYNGKRLVGDPIKLLNPETNIRTAGKLLKELMKTNNNNVFEVVAKYHSYNKERGHRYATRVINLSKALQKQEIF